MLTLVAALTALAAAVALGSLPPPRRPADGATWARRGLVALLLLLPLAHATVVLWGARDRLRTLRFDYVGKQLAFSAARPITGGGSPADAETVEDLNASSLTPHSVTLTPLPEPQAADTLPPTPGGGPAAAVLRLDSPSPAVWVDGHPLNSVPLADGDEIVVERTGGAKGEPVVLTYSGGRVTHGGGEVALEGLLSRLFGGGTRVYELKGLGEQLGVDLGGVFSLLHHPAVSGPWHLLIRSDEVALRRRGETAARFVADHPVPAELELRLAVVAGGTLRDRRRDRLHIRGERVEVRFGTPRPWAVTVERSQPEVLLALTVPSAFSRHEMIELPEPSSRFRGLSALYHYDRRADQAKLTYFGDTQEVTPGDLYALGTGDDQLWLRLDRHGFPAHLLFDLALLALYLGVFLGRGLTAHAGLAAVVGPAGVLLGHRLLFAHKAAVQPPDFAVEPFQEARLALWLVPALLVAAWAAAALLRRSAPAGGASADPGWRAGMRRLAWPLAGLAMAAVGCWVVAAGDAEGLGGGRRALALVPLLLAAALLLGERLLGRWERARSALARIQRDGLSWRPWWWAAALGLSLLAVRWGAAQIGMPETLRFPVVGFRLLWTAVQLPLAAVVVGLSLHALARGAGSETPRRWLLDLLSLGAFLALAFVAVGLAVGDTGLFLAHGLAALVGLLVLVTVPWAWAAMARWKRIVLAVLPVLPLLGVVWVNVYPETLIRIVGWGRNAPAPTETAAPVRDTAAQLGARRAQQLFRLYMLASPQQLSEGGLIASERVAVHYATLQSYADEGGGWGKGYLASQLPRHLGATYLSDLVPMVFVLADFGKVGLAGLALLYLALLAAVPLTARAALPDDPFRAQGLYVALVALLAVALPSLYMILANLNLVLFTGKNLALLSLSSLSDVIQTGGLLALAVVGLGLQRRVAGNGEGA